MPPLCGVSPSSAPVCVCVSCEVSRVCAPGGRAARGGAPRPPRPTSNMPRRPLRSLPGSANSKRPDQSSSAWTMVLCLSLLTRTVTEIRDPRPLGRDGGLRDHIFLTGRCATRDTHRDIVWSLRGELLPPLRARHDPTATTRYPAGPAATAERASKAPQRHASTVRTAR